MNFSFRNIIAFVLFLIATSACRANAQASVYGAISLTDYGYKYSGSNEIYIYNDTFGVLGGGSYLFPSNHLVKLGADLRYSYGAGSRGGEMGLAAFKIAFIPTQHRVSYYLEVGGSAISDTARQAVVELTPSGYTVVTQQQRITNGALGFAGGLDLRISPSLDYRIFDLEDAASGSSSNTAGMAAFSTGIVYHFRRAAQNP